MKRIASTFLAMLVLSLCTVALPAAAQSTCVGKFPNPVTDICWSCILPIKIGSMTLANAGSQEDSDTNPGSPICNCGLKPIIGLSIGFWEPARIVEVVRKPFCLVSLGGIDLSPGIATPAGGRGQPGLGGRKTSFYQAHYYLNLALNYLNVIADFACKEKGAFDLAYMTEVDPLWNDDMMTAVLNPEAVLFSNPAALAACVADCVKASTGFPFKEMFWCAGCQGGLYPLDGNTSEHEGGVRTAELITQRMMAKMHREMIAWGWHDKAGLCGPYLLPVMDKLAYKTQLLYPIAATGKLPGIDAASGGPGGDKPSAPSAGVPAVTTTPDTGGADGGAQPAPAITGRCCQPFGRTTIIYGAGKEYPAKGEDFSFILFRKRSCCVGY